MSGRFESWQSNMAYKYMQPAARPQFRQAHTGGPRRHSERRHNDNPHRYGVHVRVLQEGQQEPMQKPAMGVTRNPRSRGLSRETIERNITTALLHDAVLLGISPDGTVNPTAYNSVARVRLSCASTPSFSYAEIVGIAKRGRGDGVEEFHLIDGAIPGRDDHSPLQMTLFLAELNREAGERYAVFSIAWSPLAMFVIRPRTLTDGGVNGGDGWPIYPMEGEARLPLINDQSMLFPPMRLERGGAAAEDAFHALVQCGIPALAHTQPIEPLIKATMGAETFERVRKFVEEDWQGMTAKVNETKMACAVSSVVSGPMAEGGAAPMIDAQNCKFGKMRQVPRTEEEIAAAAQLPQATIEDFGLKPKGSVATPPPPPAGMVPQAPPPPPVAAEPTFWWAHAEGTQGQTSAAPITKSEAAKAAVRWTGAMFCPTVGNPEWKTAAQLSLIGSTVTAPPPPMASMTMTAAVEPTEPVSHKRTPLKKITAPVIPSTESASEEVAPKAKKKKATTVPRRGKLAKPAAVLVNAGGSEESDPLDALNDPKLAAIIAAALPSGEPDANE